MISRIYFKCLTCDGFITTRTQISHGLKQKLNFLCPHCGTDSKLVLLLDEPPIVKISFNELENLEYIDMADVEEDKSIVVNLSIDFTVPDEKSNKELYSPFIYQMTEILKDAFGENYSPEKIDGVMGTSNIEELWKDLYKAYKFNTKGNLVQRDKIIRSEELSELIFRFIGFFIGNDRLEREIKKLVIFVKKDVIQKNKSEFDRLLDEYMLPKQIEKIDSYMEIFDTFFSNYQDFKQMNLQARLGVETFKNSKVSSVNFKRTKMFYGEAFEVLGSHINPIAFINNIYNLRRYDEFKSERLTKNYLTSDKGGKIQCLEDNEILFNIFCKEYDNKLRNATHHKWLKYDEARQIISYPSSGSSSEIIKLSYTEYLLKSNNIIISLMFLLSFELCILFNLGFRINKNPL
ncbi:hypothetical protein [Acinetobacter bohemicus]|uniref:hypothetical protein n=1 Tax=Acinetobacter bohemicus TaxID=1435036 RepID=UPI004042EB72